MTDNEKAATFIGWREGQPCSHREQIDGSQWGNGIQQCFLCHCRLPIDRCFHTDPAPPMADPRNYMKALESFESQPYSTEILGPYEHEGMWYAVEFDRPLDDYAGDPAVAETYRPRSNDWRSIRRGSCYAL